MNFLNNLYYFDLSMVYGKKGYLGLSNIFMKWKLFLCVNRLAIQKCILPSVQALVADFPPYISV